MKNSKNITIEQLATLLKGKLWEKGDLKRVYLNRGYNTKKMKTNTYVFINENNEIIVSCYVDCPSQPYAWCNSQKEEVVESLENELRELLSEFEGSEPTEEKEIVATEMDVKIEAMLLLEPIEIEKNPHYNPKLTNVKRVANLSDTSFIDFYHGCAAGFAFIKDDTVVAFHYDEDKITKKLPDCKKVRVEFSCTQICFTF
jgi:hypothetical protein